MAEQTTTEQTVAEHNYKFDITMTCGGCSGAVERVLKKLDGVYFINPLLWAAFPFSPESQ